MISPVNKMPGNSGKLQRLWGKGAAAILFLFMVIWASNAACKESPKSITERKCSSCHTLQRLKRKRSKARWRKRVQQCAEKTSDWENNAKWISNSDIDIITNYLASTRLRKKKKTFSSLRSSRDRAKQSIKSNKIKKAKNPSNLSTTEMIHVPVFILPKIVFTREKFKVSVKVGQRNHPMVDKHYIQWLEVYQDERLLKKTEFRPGQEPKITVLVQIANVTDLRAVAKCSMHGLWQAEKQIHAR